MKYLYKILRLFYCPHKYIFHKKCEKFDEYSTPDDLPIAIYYICQCKYCGKFKKFRV